MLGLDRYGFDKKRVGTCYAELVFLHPVRSMGDVVHSSVSRAQNVDALFFNLGCTRYGFHKNRYGTCYVELLFRIRSDLWVTYCIPVRSAHEPSQH
jgi:hypothetical protein